MLVSAADLHKCRRFYDPQQGTLTLDGIDLRQIDRTFLHQTVALVAQEPLVFAESIEYNITFGVHRHVTQVCLSCRQLFRLPSQCSWMCYGRIVLLLLVDGVHYSVVAS
jgi:ABC-type phosphate transport system ATPase subunit